MKSSISQSSTIGACGNSNGFAGQDTALHFWFANHEGLRQQLFPSLGLGYAAWRGGDRGQAILCACRVGAAHFGALAAQILDPHRQLGSSATAAIEELLTSPQAVCPAGWIAAER